MIKILITGGTIDKQYNPLNGDLIFSESSVDEMLRQSRMSLDIESEVIMMKDSLDMKNEDREKIAQECAHAEQDKIIITHGTDTMVDSAKAISEKLGKSGKDKTIVLLGAMVPYQFKQSDALFNFACALTAVQLAEPGIYITMNGKVFDYREVVKDKEAGAFIHVAP